MSTNHRRAIRKQTLKSLTAAAIAASAIGGWTAGSAAAESSPWSAEEKTKIIEVFKNSATVYYENLRTGLTTRPAIKNGALMMPGKALLESFGYKVEWEAKERKLTAVQSGKPTLVFREGSREAQIGERTIGPLPSAPYTQDQTLWIPLRAAAEGSGMTVKWDASSRMAIVADPNALPIFSVSTRADNGNEAQPTGLEAYMKAEWKADADIMLVKPDHYREKTNLMIAAGDMKSLMLLGDSYAYNDELLQSFSMDLTDELAAFPRLKALAENGAAARSIDGRLYGVPRPADPHDAPFPALRQDWLDKLGLAQPATMDELYLVLQAFAEKDPDGDGKNNTVGLTGYINGAGLGSLSWVEHAYTGSPDRFSVKDGKVVDHAIGKEEKQALEWLARAYADGLIDKEFAVATRAQVEEKVKQGQAGAAAMSFDDALALSDQKAQWMPLPGLKNSATGQQIAPWNSSGNGLYIVSRMARVQPQPLLDWLDKGIAKTESGQWPDVQGLDETDRAAVVNLFGRQDMLAGNDALQALPEAKRQDYEAVVRQWRQTSYDGQTLPQAGGVWSRGEYAELNAKLEELKIKVILGAASMADWDRHVQEMTASKEYRAMIEELNALVRSAD